MLEIGIAEEDKRRLHLQESGCLETSGAGILLKATAAQARQRPSRPGDSQYVEGHGGGQALADLLQQVVGAEQVGAAWDQVLL